MIRTSILSVNPRYPRAARIQWISTLHDIVIKSVRTSCTKIILTHSHPHGVLLPSSADIASTRRAASALNSIGIELIDHIIVNEEDSYSMRTAGMLPDIWF